MDQQMYGELVQGILIALKDRVLRIVLYGSTARGDNSPDSDIDIAVFVQSQLDREAEDSLSDFIVDLNLKYEKVFTVIDIDYDIYSKWKDVMPFYKNLEREGIELWKAA